MGKKSSQASMKIVSKQEKKQPLNSLMKILKPKVFITDSTNFKSLVQELTGNGNIIINSPVIVSSPSPPPQPAHVELSPPSHLHHHVSENYIEGNYSPDLSYDSSSCFSTPLDQGSPDLRVPADDHESSNYNFLENSQKIYGDLESLLMEMDSINYPIYDYDASSCSYGMVQQQQVCANYDHNYNDHYLSAGFMI